MAGPSHQFRCRRAGGRSERQTRMAKIVEMQIWTPNPQARPSPSPLQYAH